MPINATISSMPRSNTNKMTKNSKPKAKSITTTAAAATTTTTRTATDTSRGNSPGKTFALLPPASIYCTGGSNCQYSKTSIIPTRLKNLHDACRAAESRNAAKASAGAVHQGEPSLPTTQNDRASASYNTKAHDWRDLERKLLGC